MNFLMRCVSILIIAVLAGCAVVPEAAPRFSSAPAAPDGYATIYLYRLGAPPYTSDIKLSIAGKPVLNAPEQAYTWVFVRAGTHTVFAEWPGEFLAPKKWSDAFATHAFEPGKSYYFRVAGNVELASGGFFSSGGILRKSYLAQLPTDAGIAQLIACCRYMQSASERVE